MINRTNRLTVQTLDVGGYSAPNRLSWSIDIDQRYEDLMSTVSHDDGGPMREFRAKKATLAAAVFACGMMGSLEAPKEGGPLHRLMHTVVTFSISTAAPEADGPIRRASCSLVRYYVAKYTEAAAESWARSKGATETEIQIARRCIKPQPTALFG